MKTQTIGVEIEMNNITRQKAAKLAADFFGTGRCENTAYRNRYMAWSAWDTQGREWKFQRDCSICGPDDQKCELVTPILTYADIETLQELCRILRKPTDWYMDACLEGYENFGFNRRYLDEAYDYSTKRKGCTE